MPVPGRVSLEIYRVTPVAARSGGDPRSMARGFLAGSPCAKNCGANAAVPGPGCAWRPTGNDLRACFDQSTRCWIDPAAPTADRRWA